MQHLATLFYATLSPFLWYKMSIIVRSSLLKLFFILLSVMAVIVHVNGVGFDTSHTPQ